MFSLNFRSIDIIKECLWNSQASLVAQLVKNPPAMQKTLVQFLGWEDPLEKGQTTYSNILGLPWWSQVVKKPPAMWETWV